MDDSTSDTSIQPYKHNGEELDRKGGLEEYGYRTRHYDAVLGRWHAVNPMTEKITTCLEAKK